jgi:hypothetical protein
MGAYRKTKRKNGEGFVQGQLKPVDGGDKVQSADNPVKVDMNNH